MQANVHTRYAENQEGQQSRVALQGPGYPWNMDKEVQDHVSHVWKTGDAIPEKDLGDMKHLKICEWLPCERGTSRFVLGGSYRECIFPKLKEQLVNSELTGDETS